MLRPWEWAPDLPTPLPGGRHLRVIMVGQRLVAVTLPPDPMIPVDRAVRVAQVDPAITPAAQVARGMGTTSGATSTAHRGAMELALGGPASRRGRHGIDRSPHLEGTGTTARSTTGVTTKRRIGTPDTTSGDLTSSECGSRCDG